LSTKHAGQTLDRLGYLIVHTFCDKLSRTKEFPIVLQVYQHADQRGFNTGRQCERRGWL